MRKTYERPTLRAAGLFHKVTGVLTKRNKDLLGRGNLL